VRPNPVLFTLPKSAVEESKENKSPEGVRRSQGLPYRSVFAVLTWDSVVIYDTFHSKPLSIIRGLHYANLADATWSADGLNLVVCSTDGYISIVSFAVGELGDVYTPPAEAEAASKDETTIMASPLPRTATPASTAVQRPAVAPLPPCDPGQTASIEAPPAKRAKKVRIAPTLVSTLEGGPSSASKRPADDADHVGNAVDKLSLNVDEHKPKKKRIQPMLVSSTTTQ
jgi:hypothetical protein